ncbi:hypothetical protein Sango_1986800 [Sesamum angolense]|uniref:DUF4378 domain-containing protein n=1 Tax=Sesamum angolense TaxID=2727404 RepID=A0AAE2BNS0_9LAMI|nr:hypothetical protein Sango_1986800 [Sesamum angolense]
MAHKQLLHELLKQDQEPFHLKSYIAERRSQLKKSSPTTTVQVKNRKPVTSTKPRNLRRHACFLSSPDVRKSPFLDFPSPTMSPCKSPAGAVFLHVPSGTTALLVEAAMRIQKQQQQQQSKARGQIKNVGFGLFGSFLKRLKDRSKNKKRVLGDNQINVFRNHELKERETLPGNTRISCSFSSGSLSRGDLEEASTSTCRRYHVEFDEINDEFGLGEERFCSSPVSPFRFSLHRSASSSGRRTPDFSSPAPSPSRPPELMTQMNMYYVWQACAVGIQSPWSDSLENGNYESRNSDNVQGEEEEKEQCSPVSVLDPFFEDDDHVSGEAEVEDEEDEDDEDYDLESCYANVQRAKEQLLHRLRRFEQLAELDPIELERKLLEDSDNEYHQGESESDEDKPLSPYRKQDLDTYVNKAFSLSSLQHNSRKSKIICLCTKEEMLRRICNRLNPLKVVEIDTIGNRVELDFKGDIVELDFKGDIDGWKTFREQAEETVAEVEVGIFELLVKELSEELFNMDEQRQELEYVNIECS